MKNKLNTPVAILLSIGLISCEDATLLQRLEVMPQPSPTLKIELPKHKTVKVQANYCMLPSKKRSFRTKFVVIFDRSGSNQNCTEEQCGAAIPGTDPDMSRRYDGLVKFVESLSDEQKQTFSFAFVNFSDPNDCSYYCIPLALMDRGQARLQKTFMSSTEFIRLLKEEKNPNNQNTSLLLDSGGTHFTSALDLASTVISRDINDNARSGTKDTYAYSVVFVSDGAPIIFRPMPARSAPPFYRQSWAQDIKTRIDSIMALNASDNVIGINLNTIFYSTPGVPSDSGLCTQAPGSFCVPCLAGDPSCKPQDLLAKMARNGGGNYLDYAQGGAIDFTRIALPSILTNYNLVEFFVRNINTVWNGPGLYQDRDADGLADETEPKQGFKSTQIDSTKTGISDRITNQLCKGMAGCNLRTKVASLCTAATLSKNTDGSFVDSDMDGLNDCEEKLLGSDPNNFDSNGDLIPDGLASLYDTSFKNGDPPGSGLDSDFDGVSDSMEIKQNTPPNIPNKLLEQLVPQQTTTTKTNSTCYLITIDNVIIMSAADKIQFTAVEQPDLFESSYILRKAEKQISGDVVIFNAEDFK